MNIFQNKNRKKTNDIIECLNLHPKCYGKENRDKTIYYICEDNGALGFFAMYRYWLEYLYFADVCGYTPVIYAGRQFAYSEERRIVGTRNPFEYYFLQPVGMRLGQVRKSSKMIISTPLHREMVELVYTGKYNNYWYTQDYLKAMSDITKKYIKINDISWKYVCDGSDRLEIQSNRVLGVHIRGTDFKKEFNNHPVHLMAEDCFAVIDNLLLEKEYDKIFVATADQRLINQFLGKYGNRMCYYEDVFRNDKNKSVVFEKCMRKEHKYQLGLEVLRDMYTLAMCDGLVAGISQVAVCAQINKLAMGKKYKDLKIIDKGIYRNCRIFRRK